MHITVFKMLAIIQMNSQPKPWIKTFSVTWILVILLLSFSCFLRRRKWRTALCITEAALFCWLICSWASCWIVITRWYFWRSRFCCNLARNHLYVNIWRFFFLLQSFSNKYTNICTSEINRTLNCLSTGPSSPSILVTLLGAAPSRPQWAWGVSVIYETQPHTTWSYMNLTPHHVFVPSYGHVLASPLSILNFGWPSGPQS